MGFIDLEAIHEMAVTNVMIKEYKEKQLEKKIEKIVEKKLKERKKEKTKWQN